MTRVVFLWSQSLLEWRSGGALTIKAMLEVLTDSGFHCHSIFMTVFDGSDEFPRSPLLGPELADDHRRAHFLETAIHGIRHRMFRTGSTLGHNVWQFDADRRRGSPLT